MMNKKGKGAISFLLSAGIMLGIIYFIIFLIVGAGGGFKALWDIGSLMKEIPAWFYIVLAMILLFKMMFGGRR